MSDTLITFPSYYFATKGEKVCKECQIPYKLIAIPPDIGGFCGLCLLMQEKVVKDCLIHFQQHQISTGALYIKDESQLWKKIPLETYR